MPLPEDRKLLDAFRRGRKEAMREVYRAYAPVVGRVLRFGFVFSSQGRRCRFRGLSSAFDVEDRLQEVFARAFSERARQGYDGVSDYQAYILRIARNLVIDDYRSRRQALLEYFEEVPEEVQDRPFAVATEPLEGIGIRSGQPEADARAEELVRLVAAFADGLPDRERQVLDLRFRVGLEQQEIASRTGLSSSRIKTSELRIRREFFRFMKRNGYFEGYRQNESGWLRALTETRREAK